MPGLGTRAVKSVLSARRYRSVRLDHPAKLTVSLDKIRPFIVAADWRPILRPDRQTIDAWVAPQRSEQLELFGGPNWLIRDRLKRLMILMPGANVRDGWLWRRSTRATSSGRHRGSQRRSAGPAGRSGAA